MRLRIHVVIVVGLAAVSCSEPLEFADWTVPVPEGTRVVSYPAVADDERTEQIELVEDLALGDDESDPEAIFYAPQEFDIDGDGNIYVHDAGNKHVKVFDADGNYVRTFGREGQGPGEIADAMGLAFVGDRLVLNDYRNAKLIHWAADGSHLGDQRVDSPMLLSMSATSDGRLVALKQEMVVRGTFQWKRLLLMSPAGEELLEIAQVPHTEFQKADDLGLRKIGRSASPSFALGSHDQVYFSAAEEYQVHRFSVTGAQQWALRVAAPRQPLPAEEIDRVFDDWRERGREESRSDYTWPDELPALHGIVTDGHGHVYVFPYVHFRSLEDLPTERPVDVYDAEGNRLFAGTIPLTFPWPRAHGDHVYTIDFATDAERTLRRYRLVEPFEDD